MGGSRGQKPADLLAEDPSTQTLRRQGAALSSPELARALQGYATGGADSGSTLAQLGSLEKQDPIKYAGMQRQLQQALATDPLTGSKFATEQVISNPLFSGVYGKGGMQERMLGEEQNLASRGWSMQPEDYEAYGQAAGETARMFGAEEQGLARALASRGLASAPSGAAGVGFSGLAGNKSERLAGAQRQIADQRMQMNLNRLNAVRSHVAQSQAQAGNLVQQQFGRQLAGQEGYQNQLKAGADAAATQAEALAGQLKRKKNVGQILGGLAGAAIGGAASNSPEGAGVGLQAGSSLGSLAD